MGDYGYDEHVELFGGPPDRDEQMRDVLDEVDQLRKEAKENPHEGSTRQPCPFYVITGDGTRSYCKLGKDHNVPHEPGRTYEEYLAALKGPVATPSPPRTLAPGTWIAPDGSTYVLRAASPDERLREALCAYRSALRSGERESAQLRALGDAALAADREAPDGEMHDAD